jgi:Mrp family chromosome partitioning ATPase
VSDLPVVSPHHNDDLLLVPERLQKYAEFIAHADTASGVIQIPPELREGLPPGLKDSILIRECYRMVLKKLEALGNDFAVVLSGTPGIGKSAFTVLLLHYLAEEGAQVAYRYAYTTLGWPNL